MEKIIFIFLIFCNTLFSQEQNSDKVILITSEYLTLKRKAIKYSNSGNAYFFVNLRNILNLHNSLIKNNCIDSNNITNTQLEIIKNIINSSNLSNQIKNNKSKYLDNYNSWIVLSNSSMKNKEVVLYEGYSFYYIVQFLYYTKINGWKDLNCDNNNNWNEILNFVEENVWTKWLNRSYIQYSNNYSLFLSKRTHMGAHWAGLANYLNILTNKSDIKSQTATLINQYNELLRRNLKVVDDRYIWNSTYDNVYGTYGLTENYSKIQDISHGNHVINFIISSIEINSNQWNMKDLLLFSNTLKKCYNYKYSSFSSNVDGSSSINDNSGNYIGDGWIKLCEYDEELFKLISNFSKSKHSNDYGQKLLISLFINKFKL